MYWLDKLFFVFHTFLVVFFLVAWKWRETRGFHLLISLVVAFSWFVLGLFYGFGYCPCTDWHWQIRAKLGHEDLPYSYMKLLIDSLLGTDLDPGIVDSGTLTSYLLILVLSAYLNVRDRWLKTPGAG